MASALTNAWGGMKGRRVPLPQAVGRAACEVGMSDTVEQIGASVPQPKLREAVHKIRLVTADQADGVSDLRAAERARLELLAEDLTGVLAEIPEGMDFFDFTLNGGETPRLWLDMTTHVGMARDRRTYRLLKDSRLGRTVLKETADRAEMALAVTDYVAERVIEREKALEGDWVAAHRPLIAPAVVKDEPKTATPLMPVPEAANEPGAPVEPAVTPTLAHSTAARVGRRIAAVEQHLRRPIPLHGSGAGERPRSGTMSFLFGMLTGILGLFLVAWVMKNGFR